MSYDPNDPDFQYLAIDKKKLIAEADPYDGAKSVMAPCKKEGYIPGEITGTKGDFVTVKLKSGEEKTFKKDHVQSRNPPKFFCIEDMANMTYLSESAVLHNLRSRYQATLIYTYSGLFCIAVNPYRRLPIYGMNVVNKFKGKKKNEVPPHLFSIADNAYSNMMVDRENQSCLITGESGAGKTENTKKVISYFALVAAAMAADAGEEKPEDDGKGSLEDQIVQCNPVLEAYGNAKTTRNNNSSRFGKFIRIHFGPTGKIAGCDIETYLLEKSRVTYQQPGIERNYHVFYQLLCGKIPEYAAELKVQNDAGLYHFINQGCLTVDNMDDGEELMTMEDAFKILGFAQQDKMALYKITASILHLGEMKFKQVGSSEQAQEDGTEEAERAASLLGVTCQALLSSILSPKFKVGTEMVTKAQNLAQVAFGIQALSKSLFARMFNEIVLRVNQTLDTTKAKRSYFIGVLDIAGFEIFDYNTFEQLCINYTNERLQQFFNHHMFVLEQEEYKKEGIQWTFIDFGMDLAACIELIEKPGGILSILEEQCMFPKATDKTLVDGMNEAHLGKSKNYGKPKPSKHEFPPHFELAHYAGNVGYNMTGWLDKNKDPVNQTVVETLQASSDAMVSLLFQPPPEPAGGGKKKSKKGAAFQTISNAHKESLGKLMTTLYSTHPHFVRCIIPNEKKTPGLVDSALVMHQLQCNGVLEGIRICQKGFPNRMIFAEFKQRYSILAPNAIPGGFVEAKVVTEKVLGALNLEENDYRCGNTKVFFRAGILGMLEDIRDERLSSIICYFQAHIRGYAMRRGHAKLMKQRTSLEKIQKNIRTWIGTRDWVWMALMQKLKPLMKAGLGEDAVMQCKKDTEKANQKAEELAKQQKVLEELNFDLTKAKNDLILELSCAADGTGDIEEKIAVLQKETAELNKLVKEFEDDLKKQEAAAGAFTEQKKKLQDACGAVKADIKSMNETLDKTNEEIANKDKQISTLNDEMARQDEAIAKLNREKKGGEDNIKKTQEDIAAEEDKANNLNKIKQKLEVNLDELTDAVDREKKFRADVEKVKRKLENDLKTTQELVEDMERVKAELEANLKKKDADVGDLQGKLEEEQNLALQLNKKIKELQRRIEELEDELETERLARAKIEKQRNDLTRELNELAEKLDEAAGTNEGNVSLTKRREAEIQKMRRDLEEAALASESTIAELKKKQQDTANEMADQLDALAKSKAKIEKDRNALKAECSDLQSQLDHITKAQTNAQKSARSLESQLADASAKLDESNRSINECEALKSRASAENIELTRQLEEAESTLNVLSKAKANLSKTLDDTKSALDDETRARSKLQGEVRTLQADVDALKDSLDEEQEARADSSRILMKTQSEAAEWRRKAESGEGAVAGAEFDDVKRKLTAKAADLEQQLEAALSKANSMEKQRNRLTLEVEDITIELERVSAVASAAEKRQRAYDKQVTDWKRKVSDLQSELEATNAEGRTHAAEVYRIRTVVDESHEAVEALRRENKNLTDEISDITVQLSDGGRSVHELEKSRKRLEMEKDELQSALEEAEAALEKEEAKVMRATLEVAGIRQEIEKRLMEKEEEFDSTRKNHQRAIDTIQASLEAESRGKAEALKMRKKLEHDINELEAALDAAHRSRGDAEKNIKKFQLQIREVQTHVEEEQRARAEARDAFQAADRRANLLAGEIEELRTQLDAAERARKQCEGELHDANDRVSELSATHTSLTGIKRKLEADVQAMQADLEDQANELKSAESNANKAMSDAARLADELRSQQDASGQCEKVRRSLEAQLKEIQVRIDEAEASNLKGGKRMIQKLETRVRELEIELDNEQRRHAETTKAIRKQDRHLKELAFQGDEDRKNHERLQAMIDGLQGKIKSFKRQAEEAEEIAAINLAKYRKVQHELEECEERADMAENTLVKVRSMSVNVSSSSQVKETAGGTVKVTVKKTTTSQVVSG